MEEVIRVLEEHYPDGVEEKEVVDENRLEEMVYEEEIPYEDFEDMVDKNINYALVDKSEE